MPSGIGSILSNLIEESGLTLFHLSQGLCSASQLTKITQNQLHTDYFVLDRLFARLGKSTDQFKYVLPHECYELYKLQYLIQKRICQKNLCDAEKLLSEYEYKKHAKKPLHKQFIHQERAQISWIRKGDIAEILVHLNTAIEQTMPLEGAVKSETALSAEELKLLLFRWEVCMGTYLERGIEELKETFEYVRQKKIEAEELVRVFPYAVLLLGMADEKETDGIPLEPLTKQALSMLREEGKIQYMPEILEQYANLLEKRQGGQQFIKTLRRERSSLLAVEREHQIYIEKYRLFQHIARIFEVDYELLKKTRIAAGMTQEELCEGICSQETLSRIESGHRSPRGTKLHEMMERMQRRGSWVSTMITTEEYEVFQIKKQLARALRRTEFEEAEKIITELEQRLDCSLPYNEQYIQAERIKILYYKKQYDWETCLEKLRKALCVTLDWKEQQPIGYELTVEENSILNMMALIYYEHQKGERAIQIFKLQAEKFRESSVEPAFCLINWELVMGNLSIVLEDSHQEEAAIELSRERVEVLMTAGMGNGIGRSLVTIAVALAQQNKEECLNYFIWGMDLLKVFKMEFLYRSMLDYVKRAGFPYSERFNDFVAGQVFADI